MANLTPTPGLDPVVQLETDTPALAGPGGIMNAQAQALLNRAAYFEQNAAFKGEAAAFTAPQRGTPAVENDLSFNLDTANNFTSAPVAGGALTFSNIGAAVGQGGIIRLQNGGNYAITAGANVKILAADLATISATGVYLLSYWCDGTNVYLSASGNLA